MAIDPQLKALLDATPALAATPGIATPPAAIRAMLEAEKGTLMREPWLPKVSDLALPAADDRSIPVRVYTPEGIGPFPLVMHFHGGGWCIGDLDHSDQLCARPHVKSAVS